MTYMGFVIFNVFFGNVVMLNYLVAIMSTTYGDMLDQGSFLFKCKLYNYCERYSIGFQNQAYGQLVLHTAPLSTLTVPLVILCFIGLSDSVMIKIMDYYSLANYWFENIFFLLGFLAVEILLIIPVYFKNFLAVVFGSYGMVKKVKNLALWFIAGGFITFYIALKDTYFLFKLLSMAQGCKHEKDEAEEDEGEAIDAETQLKIFNEVRETAIEIYERQKKTMLNITRSEDDKLDVNEVIDFMTFNVSETLDDD